MNVNKVIVVGRLTRDPELRTTPNGQTVANFSIATSRRWKDQSGQQQEKTEFHNVVAWGRQGEVIGQYVTKGQELYVEGRLETRSWDDQTTGKKIYRTEIILERFEFGAKAGASAQQSGGTYNNATQQDKSTQQSTKEEEEIPTINLEDEPDEVKIEDVPF